MEKNSALKRFFSLLSIYRKQIWQIYAFAFFIGLVNLSLPLGIQSIINYIQLGQISSSWALLVGIVLLGIALSGFLQVMQLRLVENIQHDILFRSALDFSYRLPKLNQDDVDENHLPELANRFFDTLTIQKGIPKILIDFSLATFQIIFGLLLLSFYNITFILLGIVLIVSIIFIFLYSGRRGLDYSLEESKYKYNIAHWLEDIADSNKLFNFYSSKKYHIKKTDNLVLNYLLAREKHFRVLILQFQQFIGLKIFLAAGLLIFGSIMVMNSDLNIGQFVAAEILIILIINSIEKIIRVVETIYDVLTGLEKIGQVYDIELVDNNGTFNPYISTGIKLDVVNARFQFPNTRLPVIDDLSFSVQPNSVAILDDKFVRGRTTLLKILAGLYHTQYGEILLNDIPINNYNQEFLQENVGIYFSTNDLFDGSLYDNLTLGYNIQEDYLYDLLKNVHLMEFIGKQDKGLHTHIDSNGRRLPRSVIDKILLARTLIHNPKLLLLDNPLNNVQKIERHEIFDWLISQEMTIVVASNDDYWKSKTFHTIEPKS